MGKRLTVKRFFEWINADIYCVFSAGTISAYRGKFSFGDYEIITGEKCSIFKALRILNIVWYIEGNKIGIE